MVLTIKLGLKPKEGARRRKPNVTRRIVSSESDSESELNQDSIINQPSTSRTPIDKPKEKMRIGPTLNGDSKKKNFVRPNSLESAEFGSKRAINALTGVSNGFVYQLKKKEESNGEEEAESDSSKEMNESKKCNGSLVNSSLNEEIPEGTVIVQPEAAPDGEEDWYKSKEFGKQFSRERRERKDASNQRASSPVESVFCTACATQVNPFDRKTFFCHPVLSVVICKSCMEFYDSGPWKLDDDGIEEECRWCGEGGSLSCCDFCCKTFCKRCIMRNLGRAEWNRTLSKQKWKCYVCEPSPLRELVAKCSALLSKPTKTEKKEKAKVIVQKKVVKAPKKEKKSVKMQDAAIAEEFLQYLVGNISNRALFMRSLVRLKKEVPDMQKLQMDLSLKHIGEVKSVLGEFESCVKKQLYGDVHKSDSALDGTDPEDFDSPERKSKSQMERIEVNSEPKVEQTNGDMQESAMETSVGTPEVKNADISQEESSVDAVGEVISEADAMDIGDNTELKQSGNEINVEENEKMSDNDLTADVNMEGNDGDDEANDEEEEDEDSCKGATKGKELKEKEQVRTCTKSKCEPNPVRMEQEHSDEVNVDVNKDTGNSGGEDAELPSSQNSARKLKVTPRSPRSRKESQGASPRSSQTSREDKEAKLMSMIDKSDDDSSNESEGSEYTPNKSKRSSKKSPPKARKELSKEFSKPEKEDPLSSAQSDHEETVNRREGPGQDSSNPEEESGFDGIPGESSTEASQDEATEREDRNLTEKSKDSARVTRKQSSGSSESKSSESEPVISDADTTLRSRKKVLRKSGNRLSRKKKKPKSDEMDSASEEEMELKKLEEIGGLKRKRNRSSDSEDASVSVHDAKDMPEEVAIESEEKEDVKINEDVEEKASESEEKPSKKVRKSPAKIDPKSREILSSDDSSDDESDAESDGFSGMRWHSLNKKNKKKESQKELAEKLLMEELDDDDDDEDDDDGEEEMDGAGSKRSKKKAQKKAKEEEPEEDDQDWENGESRENGTGGGGSSDDKKGDDDDDEDKKDKDDDNDEDYVEENGEEEEEEEEEDEESDDEVGTKKSHPLLRVQISGSSEEEEEDNEKTPKKKKGKKGKAAPQKKGKASKKKKRKEIDTDDYFTSSESEGLSDEKPKRKRVTRSQTASSTEDSSADLKKPKKRAKRQERNTSSDADSSKDSKPKKRAPRGKGKKRRRIKVASDSDDEDESKTQESQEEEKEKRGSDESSFDENDTPGKKGRKQIRRVLKKSKLQAETLEAEIEERERRKRIEEKRKQIIAEEDEKAEKSAVVKTCVLEKDKETDEVVLEVDERIVEHLKPHQSEGIRFIFDSTFESMKKAKEKGGGCILAHCMGLGKTLQVIAYLHTIMTNEDLNVKTCLVVAPLNTVLNWEDEFEKWIGHLDSGINVYEMSSVKTNSSRADYLDHWHKKGGVMILGYAMYRNLALLTHIRKKKEKAIFLKTLVNPGPDIVVCDEGHMLKNESSAISKAMNNISTLRRICLTGTPLQNNLIEYHCMVHFVKPNLLGTMREFKNRFVNPITNGQHSDSTARDVKIMKRRAHVLHNLLSGCVQRKDYTALTKFLPPKHEFVISVRLSDVQIKLYEHYLNTLSGRKDDGTKTQCTSLFADYQSLMNVWTHPRLLQLATQREDRNAARRDIDDFVTSEEEEDDDDSVKAFVISSDSDLEDPWKSSSKKKAERSSSNSPRPRATRSRRGGGGYGNSDSDDDDEDGAANNDGNNSDSSVEVVKSWNTRSRAKEAGLSEGASTSAADFFIPPEPEKVIKWYSDFFTDDDVYKIELSGKLVLLFEILKMAESVGEKVLVFSQSLLSLDMIEDMLAHLDDKAQEDRANGEQDLENQIGGTGSWIKGEDYFRMDGSTPAATRRRCSEIFNDLENIRARLFLISTRAGSLGTNLIAANRVIIFDANWNPSHDIQSIFRVYRFGQERAVFIYRFIAQGTMEEKIYDRQVIKQSLSQRVVDEHQIERHFTSADLSELYNFTPDRLDDPDRPERPTPVLPKDFFLAELLKTQQKWIVKYHEHDSLLENQMEEELTEEERQEAWKDYDHEKNRQINMPVYKQYDPQDMERIYKEGESILRMGEMMLNYPGQSGSVVVGNHAGHPSMPMGGPSVGGSSQQANNVRRLLEMQSMYRAQMQQQQRQQQIQREQQQLQQRLMMLQQAGEQPNSAAATSSSMRQLQQIAMLQQQHRQQQQQQQQQLLRQQQLLKQRQQQPNASSSEGKAP